MPPPYCYAYPRPAVTVDLAIFALDGDDLRVLLIRRKRDPFAGSWALPGGFLEIDEAVEDGARRELGEETGLRANGPIAFLGVFADPARDPRGRTISLSHATVLRGSPPEVAGKDDASEAAWRLARCRGPLAFDHDAMLGKALEWLADGVKSGQLGLAMLPEEFNLSSVKALFHAVFGSSKGASLWLGRMQRDCQVEATAGTAGFYRMIPQTLTNSDPPR